MTCTNRREGDEGLPLKRVLETPAKQNGIGTHNLKLETRNSKLRIAQVAAIAVLALLFLGADTDARFNAMGHQLMCMCSCNQVLLECNHVGCTFSSRMRDELSAGIARGDNNSLVLQSFVQKYGNVVLAAPTTPASIALPGSCRSRCSGWRCS